MKIPVLNMHQHDQLPLGVINVSENWERLFAEYEIVCAPGYRIDNGKYVLYEVSLIPVRRREPPLEPKIKQDSPLRTDEEGSKMPAC